MCSLEEQQPRLPEGDSPKRSLGSRGRLPGEPGFSPEMGYIFLGMAEGSNEVLGPRLGAESAWKGPEHSTLCSSLLGSVTLG